jgi:tetratricopeptide (TPR) repeat protein
MIVMHIILVENRHLALPHAVWDAERSASMRNLAKCCLNLNKNAERLAWLRRACAEAPGEREPWLELAQLYLDRKDYLGGYYAAKQALRITDRPPTYITNADAWGNKAYDIAGTCASYLGLVSESRELIGKALAMDPVNRRLIANMKFVNREYKPVVERVPTKFFIISDKLDKEDFGGWMLSANNPEHIVLCKYSDSISCNPGDMICFSDSCPFQDGWDRFLFDEFLNFDGYAIIGEGCIAVDYYSYLFVRSASCFEDVKGILVSNQSLECKNVFQEEK